MKVLALVPYPPDSAPGQRYRIEQWAPYLSAQGIEVTFRPFATPRLAALLYEPRHYRAKLQEMLRGTVRRWAEAWGADRYDLVLICREACLVGPAWAERLAYRRRPSLVYDFDDAVYLPYVSPANRYLSYLKFPSKTAALCRMASAVMAGNETLAGFARRHNSRVHVVPSTVSLRSYRPRPGPRRHGPPVIGWTGSYSSAPFLGRVAGALRRLRQRREFRFVAIGARPVDLPGVEVEWRAWTSTREVEDLWELDIGIMPLADDPWTRAKCGLKAIQYMGVGIPPVVSPVGGNVGLVEDGVNGFLAGGEDEWVEKLERLLAEEELRRRLGAEGRRTVETRYSAEVQAPRVAEILRSALTPRPADASGATAPG